MRWWEKRGWIGAYLGEERVETVDFLALFDKGIVLGYSE